MASSFVLKSASACAASASLALFVSVTTSVSATVYDNRADFVANVGSTEMLADFSSYPDFGVQFPSSPLVISDKLTFSTPGILKIFGKGIFNTGYPLLDADESYTTLTMTFAEGVDAVGFNFGTLHYQSPDFIINVYDAAVGGTLLYTTGAVSPRLVDVNGFDFLGIAEVGSIYRVEITGGHAISVTNVEAVPAAVPEPASAALLLGAAAGTVALRRRS